MLDAPGNGDRMLNRNAACVQRPASSGSEVRLFKGPRQRSGPSANGMRLLSALQSCTLGAICISRAPLYREDSMGQIMAMHCTARWPLFYAPVPLQKVDGVRECLGVTAADLLQGTRMACNMCGPRSATDVQSNATCTPCAGGGPLDGSITAKQHRRELAGSRAPD